MRLLSAVLLTACLAAPLAAADGEKDQAPKKEKRVCRSGEPTGSRLVIRTCHTQAEWDALDREREAQADRELDRQQTMSRGGGSGYDPN